MADVFKTPGVYIKEIPTFPPSVAEVETAIPAFIGYTDTAIFNGRPITEPTRISSLLEYQSLFGGAQPEKAVSVTIKESTVNGTKVQAFTAKIDEAAQSRFRMFYALQLYFANGGGPCYIVSVGDYAAAPTRSKLEEGLAAIARYDEPTLLVFPDGGALDAAEYYALVKVALDQCEALQDRFTIMDVQPAAGANPVTAAMTAFRGAAALGNDLNKLKYGAAYFPALQTLLNPIYTEGDIKIKYIKDGTDLTDTDADAGIEDLRMTDLAAPRDTLEDAIKTGLGLPNSELYNRIKSELSKVYLTMPASPAVAGVYAQVDSSRGVWKAPANVSLSLVLAPAVKISNEDQSAMNVDQASGKSVNAIRSFFGKGVLVWGARTLAGNDNEWRYVSVRRFFNFAEESIRKGTEWVVFEPNDANTWIRVKAMIENFLQKQWRAGALAGAKPEHAYFVNVGLGTTMTALDVLEGRMYIEIGMAVVRPAEFIILKFMHKMQES